MILTQSETGSSSRQRALFSRGSAQAKAYVPPHLRNNPQALAAKAKGPKFREEYEKPSNQRQEAGPGQQGGVGWREGERWGT